MTRAATAVALLCAAVITGVAPGASAQSARDRTIAEGLFREGKKLMDEQRFAEACPKLAESQRLDPGGGTLLNVAVCHEKEGKTATAWMEFQEALALARRDGRDDRVTLAEAHLGPLEKMLPRLTLQVPEASRVPGLTLTVDGVELGEAAWASPVPSDPGDHVVVATAPGYRAWRGSVASKAGETASLTVPRLEAGATTAPSARTGQDQSVRGVAPDESADGGGTQRTIGWIVTGVGGAGLIAGGVFGFQAISKRKDSDAECKPDCTDAGQRLNDEAKSAATASNILFGVGIVGVGVGLALVLTAAGSEETPATATVTLAPALARGGGGVSVAARF